MGTGGGAEDELNGGSVRPGRWFDSFAMQLFFNLAHGFHLSFGSSVFTDMHDGRSTTAIIIPHSNAHVDDVLYSGADGNAIRKGGLRHEAGCPPVGCIAGHQLTWPFFLTSSGYRPDLIVPLAFRHSKFFVDFFPPTCGLPAPATSPMGHPGG